MKKIIPIAIVLILTLTSFVSCGNSWEITKKNLASNYTELPRRITVTDLDGNDVWNFEGVAYISDDSSVGDVTIIYQTDMGLKKIDFIGIGFNVMAVEL